MTPDALEQVRKLIRLLATENEHERLTALSALQRGLVRHGLDFNDLAAMIGSPPMPSGFYGRSSAGNASDSREPEAQKPEAQKPEAKKPVIRETETFAYNWSRARETESWNGLRVIVERLSSGQIMRRAMRLADVERIVDGIGSSWWIYPLRDKLPPRQYTAYARLEDELRTTKPLSELIRFNVHVDGSQRGDQWAEFLALHDRWRRSKTEYDGEMTRRRQARRAS